MTTKTTDKEKKKTQSLRYQRDKDRELVKGVFRFYEAPGAPLSFTFRKYKQDPVERYDFLDGETYTIPLGVAKHLNTSGSYPVHKYMMDESGKPVAKVGQKVNRYGFQSLEFMDIEDFPNKASEIVTVEAV